MIFTEKITTNLQFSAQEMIFISLTIFEFPCCLTQHLFQAIIRCSHNYKQWVNWRDTTENLTLSKCIASKGSFTIRLGITTRTTVTYFVYFDWVRHPFIFQQPRLLVTYKGPFTPSKSEKYQRKKNDKHQRRFSSV